MTSKVFFVIILFFSFIFLVKSQCSIERATPKLRKAIFDFTTKIINRVSDSEDNHFVVSPLSLWTILAVIYEGAREQTRTEMTKAMRFPRNSCLRKKFYRIVNYLTEEIDTVEFERAGLVLLDKSLHVGINFNRTVSDDALFVDIKNYDFSDTYKVTRYVNDYAKEKTRGYINDIVAPDDFENYKTMLLLDTVYFKAPWKDSFDPSDTAPNIFYDDDQNEIGTVNMMSASGKFKVADMANIQARVLELPYGSEDRFAMLVVLPYEDTQLKTVIEALDQTTISAIYHEFNKQRQQLTDVYLPRFKVETKLKDLKQVFMDLGIKTLFDSRADLSGILVMPHFVDAISQKAYIEVSENGTVAGSISNAFFDVRTVPNLFQANKPFLYLIIEKYTSIVIFCGAYSKPSLE